MSTSIEPLARSRGVTRLVHFTPLNNLLGIVRAGAVLPRSDLAAYARENPDLCLLDFAACNDACRLDARPDCVNLSVQHPNAALLRRFRERCLSCDVWSVLLLSPACLALEGTLFAVGNAASSHARRLGFGCGVAGFEALFREEQHAANLHGAVIHRRDGLPACYPTDPQAEVLIPARIPLRLVRAAAFPSPLDAARARAALELAAPGVSPPELVVDPTLFGPRPIPHTPNPKPQA